LHGKTLYVAGSTVVELNFFKQLVRGFCRLHHMRPAVSYRHVEYRLGFNIHVQYLPLLHIDSHRVVLSCDEPMLHQPANLCSNRENTDKLICSTARQGDQENQATKNKSKKKSGQGDSTQPLLLDDSLHAGISMRDGHTVSVNEDADNVSENVEEQLDGHDQDSNKTTDTTAPSVPQDRNLQQKVQAGYKCVRTQTYIHTERKTAWMRWGHAICILRWFYHDFRIL